MNSVSQLQSILKGNLNTGKGGLYSVCSSKEEVIRSAMLFARSKEYPLLIESTSNQVDQYGGYTGMRPHDFASYTRKIAASCDYPVEKLLLGGDHLGPNAWQAESPESSMAKAADLIRSYIEAGYRKIHLDTSMPCKGDPKPLSDAIVAERAAALALVAETAWKDAGSKGEAPVYIIGTEVPTPGGSKAEEEFLQPTSPEAAKESYRIHREAFVSSGLGQVWEERIIAMVVQPGVEFGDHEIIYFDESRSAKLSQLAPELNLVFEAHSTDYQRPLGLQQLVKNHFAILKVGPWLSFAFREALFSLSYIAQELQAYGLLQNNMEWPFTDSVQEYLSNKPQYWKNYYRGSDDEIAYKCLYSLSDRIRYYWPQDEMQALCRELLASFGSKPIPYSLVSQFFPQSVQQLEPKDWRPQHLIEQHIQSVLAQYDAAIAKS